ncbi:MAG: DUF1800 domain-containing protein [Planctomycetes bacterium]|nr:DUF1800 domain-containing protein [Planctomycetota bacterium]MCB9904954.1 DUF1800 domain-containing protein [Planctomycetota bacterium]
MSIKSSATCVAVLVLTLFGASLAVAQNGPEARAEAPSRRLVWNARTVEHLYNRAGFGATPEQVEEALARRPEDVVEELVSGGREVEPFYVEGPTPLQRMDESGLTGSERARLRSAIRGADRKQMSAYSQWWLDAMASGADPLRDRMTLFWHGFFTSSYRDVRRSDLMAQQHEMLRSEALGSYAVMLFEIVHDPAMLKYLNNDVNKKGANNENFARELMELFSLGEGNYTEQDIKEVARALTGMRFDLEGDYKFRRGQHDFGKKTVLGEKGRLDGEDVVEILLEQEACARYVAGRVIEFLEGVAPSEQRLDFYSALLRESKYELAPLLRSLLLDPDFYRDEVVGTRVQGPVDFAVGAMIRLEMRVPATFVREATAELGQELFLPPSVKGWEEGPAWITTSSLMLRGNLAGMMLGVVDLNAVFGDRIARARELARGGEPRRDGFDSPESEVDDDTMRGNDDMMGDDEMMESDDGALKQRGKQDLPKVIRDLRGEIGSNYIPRINLRWRMQRAGLTRDAEIATYLLDAGLAIEAPEDLHTRLMGRLRGERDQLGVKDGELLNHPEAEKVLRRALHWVLSTPAAQLS